MSSGGQEKQAAAQKPEVEASLPVRLGYSYCAQRGRRSDQSSQQGSRDCCASRSAHRPRDAHQDKNTLSHFPVEKLHIRRSTFRRRSGNSQHPSLPLGTVAEEVEAKEEEETEKEE